MTSCGKRRTGPRPVSGKARLTVRRTGTENTTGPAALQVLAHPER